MQLAVSQREAAMLGENLQVKRRRRRPGITPVAGDHTLCEPAQSKCTRTFHKTRAILYGNLRVRCRRPRPRRRLCASLRGRNPLGPFTKLTLCENLQVKCCRPAGLVKHRLLQLRPCQIEMCIWVIWAIFRSICRANSHSAPPPRS